MNVKEYLQTSGISGQKLAVMINVAPSYLSQMISAMRPWKPAYCVSIERITEGKVTRQDLRPNDYWLIWPELKAPKNAKPAAQGDVNA